MIKREEKRELCWLNGYLTALERARTGYSRLDIVSDIFEAKRQIRELELKK